VVALAVTVLCPFTEEESEVSPSASLWRPTGKYQLVVSKKNWKTLRQKLKEATRKTSPMSFEERITTKALAQFDRNNQYPINNK